MKSIRRMLYLSVFVLAVEACAAPAVDRDTVYQAAPIQSLSVGVYDGFIPFSLLKKHGDIGLGTFNALDGEMVCVDGIFYQVKHDGKVLPVSDSALTPFAVVTYFEEDLRLKDMNAGNLDELAAGIDERLPTKNLFYAVRIDGVFEYIKIRSVPAQAKPYVPLVEAAKKQTVFEHRQIQGTVVGFRCPSFTEKINMPGYHFHFLSTGKDVGGHVLDLRFKALTIRVDQCAALLLIMPDSGIYFKAGLDGEEQRDLKKIE
jgi:acetolactate decarboxylase